MKKTTRPLLLLFILLATALRLGMLETHSVAFDEGFSLTVSSQDWPTLFRAILSDGVHPPFFYMVFKIALVLYGHTEFGARFFTAIFSIAAIPTIYTLGKTLYNRQAGLWAALLLTCNPLHIWLAQEARMYSLLIFLITLNFWFFWQTLRGKGGRVWLGLGSTATLIFVIHYFGFLVPIIQFTFLVLTLKRHHRLLRPWTVTQIGAGLLLVPWLIFTALRQVKSFGIAFLLKPDLLDLPLTIWNMLLGLSFDHLFLAIPGLLLMVGLIAFALKDRTASRAHLLLLLWGGLPPALVWVMSQQRSFYADRYFSFTICGLILLVAYGLSRVHPPLKYAAGGLLTVILLANHLLFLNHPPYLKDNWRGVTTYITSHQQTTDLILLRSPHIQLPFDYYYTGPSERRLSSFNQEIYTVETVVGEAQRVWVVIPYTRRPTHYPYQPLTDKSVWELDPHIDNLQTWLTTHQTDVVDNQRFLGVEIWLVETK